jgi:hypothetical protein
VPAAGPDEKQVLRFEVAVHDAARVRDAQDVEDVVGDPQEFELAHRGPALQAVLQRLAVEELHHEVRRASRRAGGNDVVVEHLHCARVIDAVGGVALAKEPLAHFAVPRQVGVKELDGAARAVAMARRVHGGHAADAEKALEGPLVVEHAADTRPRSSVSVFVQTASLYRVPHDGRSAAELETVLGYRRQP